MDAKEGYDCEVLLSYVAKHRSDQQSIRSLAEACGIPDKTLQQILNQALDSPDGTSILHLVAYKYRYQFKVYDYRGRRTKGRVIDVVRTDPCQRSD